MNLKRYFILIWLASFMSVAGAETGIGIPGLAENVSPELALAVPQDLKPVNPIKSVFYSPLEMLERYFDAVNRGALTVYGRLITKAMLVPIRVENIYEIKSGLSSWKIYSELEPPMEVAGQVCCKIIGVGAVLDPEGGILETEIHLGTGK